ncbi:Hypothetical Protein SLY_0240 [Strawberry lethal yellows phytoplasma (CPA) str. NZSb11]|uniref:Uncharacterized protein n=1 Tax=Strawberry lethal yellows phytoplasma (CPA) str. NZSb11 TaxID=980422 RepID=R4RWC7_PHYAS|nr:Hypothetical Protein SLY_0240 [Strawberry lethal yellows phytoplasma (CPA) str. NZSb11]
MRQSLSPPLKSCKCRYCILIKKPYFFEKNLIIF